ncbi:ActS/PrrB/RegB family redox-sensitive histidine kinase [Caulobacter sp. SLTY]|uniref:ActS/PrrB/RegB family redox-sensitive histidine kinase n=1 Tax=Caulobacter sp. SLTY TaxID=2683262 RepID=UPI001F0CFA39|nr:ActS/PrrB/RegB family redox-sensitive histidine kinase [Caulobacter sp. SLTY]
MTMLSPPSSANGAAQRGLDRPGEDEAQPGAGPAPPWWGLRDSRRARLRIRTLVFVRWLAVFGQLATVIFVAGVLRFPLPLAACLTLIALAAWMNVLVWLASSTGQRQAADWEATAQLAFDILQLSGMLYLTGGSINPFSLLIIAPVVLAAATLPLRHVLGIAILAIVCIVGLSMTSLPLPGPSAVAPDIPLVNRVGNVISRILGIAFCAGYAWQAASEAARMELALDTTNAVLAREQRLSALGALAAAAAHELGTPLATISIVAKEMARGAGEGTTLKEDADLLVSQAERCRDILRRLTSDPDATDDVHGHMSLGQLVEEAIAPHTKDTEVRVEAVISGPRGEDPPEVRRLPEVLHALTSYVENAVDFARSEVLITARFDDRAITLEVKDDGPGFSPDIYAKLGEPYVTSRPGAEGSRSGHIGMGLGFFISKTLMERTGGVVTFRNGKAGGAVVTVRWPREALAAVTDGNGTLS